MARVKYDPFLEPLLNQHYGYIFQPNNYGQSMNSHTRSKKTRTSRQFSVMQFNQVCITNWRNMLPGTQAAWDSFAAAYPQASKRNPSLFLTGYQLFVKRNYYQFLCNGIGSGFILSPAMEELPADAVTFSIASGSNEVDITDIYIANFGQIPAVGQSVLFRCMPFATGSGQFFEPILQKIIVDELPAGRLVVSISQPASPVDITYPVFLSKPVSPGKSYVGSQVRYMASLGIPPPPPIYSPNYGLLYNWYSATDVRNITPIGWRIPLQADFNTLIAFLVLANSGNKIREVGTDHWTAPNSGATDEVGFHARGAGNRNSLTNFVNLKNYNYFWVTDKSGSLYVQYSCTYNQAHIATSYGGSGSQKIGVSLRPVKISTTLTHGQTGLYVGNDGKVYETICIGTQEFLSSALCETRFRDGSIIPWHGANPANYFTNSEWSALLTSGTCAYQNNLSNVAFGFLFP